MLRNESPLTQLVNADKVEQILDEIETYGQILYSSTALDSVIESLDDLTDAINAFEENKFDDYYADNTEHADQFLSAFDNYNTIYSQHLVNDRNVSTSSTLLKEALTDYASSVQGLRDEIIQSLNQRAQAGHLGDALVERHYQDRVTQNTDMLLSNEKLGILGMQAEILKYQFEEAGLLGNDALADLENRYLGKEYADGYDYFGVMDMDTSSDSDWLPSSESSDESSMEISSDWTSDSDSEQELEVPYFPATFDFEEALANDKTALHYSFDFDASELRDFWNQVDANHAANLSMDSSTEYDNVVSEDSRDQSSEAWNLDDIFDPSSSQSSSATDLDDVSTDDEIRLSGGSWSSSSPSLSRSSATFFKLADDSDAEEDSYREEYSPKGYIAI